MEETLEERITTKASTEKVWDVLNDFESISQYSPLIKSATIISDITSGVGTKRKCVLKNGSTIVEEIIAYEEGESYEVELSEFSLPIESARVGIGVEGFEDEEGSEIYMTVNFVPKSGILGSILGKVFSKGTLQKTMKYGLKGLAFYATTGKAIGDKLPSKKALLEAIPFGKKG